MDIQFKKYNKTQKEELIKVLKTISKESNAKNKDVYKKLRWEWQYEKLPSKKTHIYLAISNRKIVGYMHFPVYEFIINKQKLNVASKQSVGILKKFNGLGIFKRLSIFANDDLNNHVDFIYTFPNDKAIHTYIKYNKYHKIFNLPFYIKFIKSKYIFLEKVKISFIANIVGYLIDKSSSLVQKNLNHNDKIEELDISNKKMHSFFNDFSGQFAYSIYKSTNYLNWRYKNTFNVKHYCYALKRNEELKACIIIKKQNFFGVSGITVMDFAFNKKEDLLKLLDNIHTTFSKNKSLNNISFILLSGTQLNKINFLFSGFFYLPQLFVPRKLTYLLRKTKKNKLIKETILENSLITLGDWDVF